MYLAFFLRMSSCPSWNGKWSGDGRRYVIVKHYTTARGKSRASEIAAKECYSYHWSDGWSAEVKVVQVDAQQARSLKSESQGFSGYDWMVDTICSYGKPMCDSEVKEFLGQTKEAAC